MSRTVPWSTGLVLLTLLLASAGCASLNNSVRKRAASDFACAQDKVRIVDEYATIFRVSGCGSVATYRCSDTPAFAVHCHRIVWDAPETHEVTQASEAGERSQHSQHSRHSATPATPER